MCLIRTYDDDIDYPPPRRVIRADSYRRRRRSISHSPPLRVVGIRQRISLSPVRSIRERLERVSVEEVHPRRRPSVQFSRDVVRLPQPPPPPPLTPAPGRVVREVEVVREDSGTGSLVSSSSSGSSWPSSSRPRSHGTSTVRSYDTRGGKDYVVQRTMVERERPREWRPVKFNVDTSRERSRSRSRKGEWYVEEPRGSGIYRREGGRAKTYYR
ncbi:MAG: hypothetical protein M1822_002951 [Bathelium mastoideum]|nr:MAG: hypothetical protein M1822_002951 [Bathelium mastoideum]